MTLLGRYLRVLLVSAACCSLSGCYTRGLPLPPPSVTAQAFTVCAPTECPQGGVIVVLQGTSQPSATVLLEDTAPHATAPTGETLLVGTVADGAGAWRLVMGPVLVRGTPTVLAPRVGDTLSVYQITVPSNEVSSAAMITVLAPR